MVGPRALVLLAVAGCTGTIDETAVEGLTPEQAKAQTAWVQRALPAFKAACSSCHDGSEAANPAYLAGMADLDIRDTLLAFSPPLVNLSAPQSSRVLTKGNHEGPALLADQASGILAWITAQRDATPPPAGVEVPQFTPMLCTSGAPGTATCPINTIDLSALGATGSSITMVASLVGSDLYLTQLAAKAGTGGLDLVHPLFESWPAGATMATPDPQDRFFSVNINVMTGSANLGDGTATFTGFGTDPISIRIDTLGTYKTGP